MLASNRRVFFQLLVILALNFILVSEAAAICLPIAYNRYVGNTATDAACTDDSIQAAINNSVCPTTIYVTKQRAWTAQHLDINNKNVTIVGTSASCGPPTCSGTCPEPPTSPQVTISGAGHSGDSVIWIHGNSNVTLKWLAIKNGNNVNGANITYGGGIHFDGTGSLTLETTWVTDNQAIRGGGINFHGNGGPATLTLAKSAQIVNNTAASGGGIRINGNAYLKAVEDRVIIALNDAVGGFGGNGNGGGIELIGPARADLGSPGAGGLGILYANTAIRGGGMSINADGGHDAEVSLYTTEPLIPVRIHGNFASESGGGVYLKPYASSLHNSHARLFAFDFRIDNNAAAEGSAIYADRDTSTIGFDSGSGVYMNDDASLQNRMPPNFQPCAPGVVCNSLDGNIAIDAASNPTLGATILIRSNGSLYGNRIHMRGNKGGYAVRLEGENFHDYLTNCLLVDNDFTRQLIRAEGSIDLSIRDCTLANNVILSTATILAQGTLDIWNTIIDQPGNLSLDFSGSAANLDVSFVLAAEVNSLPAVAGVVLGQPTYVNAAAGNYRLTLASKGVDFAPAVAGDDRDLDNLPRDLDLPEVPNFFGPRDLGAYERKLTPSDLIFRNGFE